MNEKPLTHTDQFRKPVNELMLNELCFDEDRFYDRECFWGRRYGNYAVYCHHGDGPMKCSGYDCEFFKENEPIKEYKE